MPRVPLELCDYIIDFLHDDASSLRECSLACRAWVAASHFHLFRSVVLQDPVSLIRFHLLLERSPDIGYYVRELTVTKLADVGPGDASLSPTLADVAKESVVGQTLLQLLAAMPSLRSLTLLHADMKCVKDIRALAHTSVVYLNLSWCQFADFADIVDLVGCFPNLADLSLSGLTWKDESRVPNLKPNSAATLTPTLRTLTLGRDTDSEKLFEWFESEGFHTSVTSLTARCVSERDTDLLGPYLKLAGASLRHLDLDWSMSGDKTIILPENVSLSGCAALESLTLHFPLHYSTKVPWVTSLLATLDSTSIRSISCDVRLLGNIDALDWDKINKILSSEAFRSFEKIKFAVNLWPGVHKDIEEVEGLVRARLSSFDRKGMLRISKA